MRNGQLPEWLYNALPHIYITCGVLAIIKLDNGLAIISGLILVSVGSIVFMLRHKNRKGYIGLGKQHKKTKVVKKVATQRRQVKAA